MKSLVVIGGGLAGCEAAWQSAQRGMQVILYEMRPARMTPAHTTGLLAELVCSNSLGSFLPIKASGILMAELRQLDSLLIRCAEKHTIPAGSALALDRSGFAQEITATIQSHPNIMLIHEEISEIPFEPAIIASGPLTSPLLSKAIQELTGEENFFFYDAIAPTIYSDSINMKIAFSASRYNIGSQEAGDYLNCPLSEDEYLHFQRELILAGRVDLKEFEVEIHKGVQAGSRRYFEGCLPIEVLAERGRDTLAYGPMRPVGIKDPRTNTRPYAVLQLRQDNLVASQYSLVGFQTNLLHEEQKRVLHLIPGLENAEFIRYGQMHRNTFIASPLLINSTLEFRGRPELYFAGQITGVEGYLGNIATGWLAGVNAFRYLSGLQQIEFPRTTMLGSLCYYISHAPLQHFQPMKANLGLLDETKIKFSNRELRAQYLSKRSIAATQEIIAESQIYKKG